MPIRMPAMPETFSTHLQRVQQGRRAEQADEFNALRMQQAQQAMRDDQTVRGILSQYGGDYEKAAGAAAAAGVSPDSVAHLYDRARQSRADRVGDLKSEIEIGNALSKAAEGVVDQVTYDQYRELAGRVAQTLGRTANLPPEYDEKRFDAIRARGKKWRTEKDGGYTFQENVATGERKVLTKPDKPRDVETWGEETVDPATGERVQKSNRNRVRRTKPPDGAKPLSGTFSDAVKSLGEVVTDVTGAQKVFVPPETIAEFQDWTAKQQTGGATFSSWADAVAKFRESQRTPPTVPPQGAPAPPSAIRQVPMELRVPGQEYPTMRGPMVWDGEGWITPQEWRASGGRAPGSGVTVNDIMGLR